MTNHAMQPDLQSPPLTPTADLSFMDKFFSQLGGCTVAFFVITLPFIALLVGMVGLVACSDLKARERATWQTVGGAIWFGICLLIIFAGLSLVRR